MNERIAKWDERYRKGEGEHGFEPSPPLLQAIQEVAPGLALDIACGAGRHAIFLAERGWRVVAVDGSRAGLERLREESGRRGIGHRIEARLADLERRPRRFAIRPAAYDLICDFYFLDRTLFDKIRAGVRPGGLFVVALHVALPEDPAPGNPAFSLLPGELKRLAAGWGWEILHSLEGPPRESGHERATAELIARRP